VRGIKPFFVQQSSNENEPDVVATEIGRGGIFSTSTNRLRIPVIQMFAPPSMREGLSIASIGNAERITFTYEPSSPFNP
jgi:hypothetical protein